MIGLEQVSLYPMVTGVMNVVRLRQYCRNVTHLIARLRLVMPAVGICPSSVRGLGKVLVVKTQNKHVYGKPEAWASPQTSVTLGGWRLWGGRQFLDAGNGCFLLWDQPLVKMHVRIRQA